MKRAYKFRIYPNKYQEIKLNRILSTCRHLYNEALSERKKQAELNRLKKEFDVFPSGKARMDKLRRSGKPLITFKDRYSKRDTFPGTPEYIEACG